MIEAGDRNERAAKVVSKLPLHQGLAAKDGFQRTSGRSPSLFHAIASAPDAAFAKCGASPGQTLLPGYVNPDMRVTLPTIVGLMAADDRYIWALETHELGVESVVQLSPGSPAVRRPKCWFMH